jgi:hypothetical protein
MKGKNAPRYAGPVHSVAEVLAEPRRGKPLRAMVLAKRLCADLPGNAASIRRLLLGPKPSIPKFSVLAAISVETTERESVAFDKVGASLAVAFLRSRQRMLSLDCWMAGDLLGDHVHVSVGYPALTSLIDSRIQPAAFRGAIHGLKMIYSRVDARKRRFIVGELKGLALLHGDRGVRVSASVALYSLGEESGD